MLQTTSYNFTGTSTTEEVCVGVIKAHKVHQKPSPTCFGHWASKGSWNIIAVFTNVETGDLKSIECVRIDGAADEGPSHEEVQFWRTARHIAKCRQVTLVTTRSSGSSYLNRVELLNRCRTLDMSALSFHLLLRGHVKIPWQVQLIIKNWKTIWIWLWMSTSAGSKDAHVEK